MSANQACFPIATMARVLGVSKAGYHAWVRRPPSAHTVADKALPKRVRTVHATSRQTYGHRACMPICKPAARDMAASGSHA
jgi:putative transposase